MQLKRKRRGRASLSVSVIKLGTKLERLCGFLFVVYPFIFFFFSIIAPCETNYARQNKRGCIYLSNCHVSRLKTPGRRAWGLALRTSYRYTVRLDMAPLCGQTKKFTWRGEKHTVTGQSLFSSDSFSVHASTLQTLFIVVFWSAL